MGDTYFIEKINCAYCDKENDFDKDDELSFYPGIGYTYEDGAEFTCEFCKKKNIIIMNFKAVKIINKKSVRNK